MFDLCRLSLAASRTAASGSCWASVKGISSAWVSGSAEWPSSVTAASRARWPQAERSCRRASATFQQTPHIFIGFRLQPLLQQRGHGRGRFPL
ncbi:hypothetical protein LNO78_12230 [Klebsiella pneumoniae subsp. pneumoniae]|nr:hypothetical protein [Klebsiella pneumoniae subsp. pneumoniae]